MGIFDVDYNANPSYNAWLDEIYPLVEVAGHSYLLSRVLHSCDPIAYRVGLSDWESETEAFSREELEYNIDLLNGDIQDESQVS